jgi:hypothetical protein
MEISLALFFILKILKISTVKYIVYCCIYLTMSFATQSLPYKQFQTDVLPRPIVSSGQWDASKYVSSAVGGQRRKTTKKTASKSKKYWGISGGKKMSSKSKKRRKEGDKNKSSRKRESKDKK